MSSILGTIVGMRLDAADAPARRTALLRQQRSRRTRERLLEAASRLWLTRGYDEVHISDICRAAGVSNGSFHFHFANKDELLLEQAARGAQRVWEDWDAVRATSRSTKQILKGLLDGIAQRISWAPTGMLDRVLAEIMRSQARWRAVRSERADYAKTFAEIIDRGQERGEITAACDPVEAGAVLAVIVVHGQQDWARDPCEPLADLLWRRCQLFLGGIEA